MSAPLTPHQIKVLILYTLGTVRGTVPRSTVETVLARCDANLFEIQLALSNLLENDNLVSMPDEDGTEYLRLTPQGAAIIEPLKKDVPIPYRERAMAFAAEEVMNLRDQIGIRASVREIQKEEPAWYACDMEMKSVDLPLMQLSFYAPNKLQADMIAERFRKNPQGIYRKFLRILTGADEEIKDD